MSIQIVLGVSQYIILTQVVDSESSKTSIFASTVFFAVVHIFSGYLVCLDNTPETVMTRDTFLSSVILPVILGTVLRLVLLEGWVEKSATPKPTLQVRSSPENADILEATVQKLEAYLEQIKRQKEQIETNPDQNIKPRLSSINSKLAHLQNRIDEEVAKNGIALNRLMFISSEMRTINENLNKLQKLQVEKDSFSKEFQTIRLHLLTKARATSKLASKALQQTQKVAKQPRKMISDEPISERLLQIEHELKAMQRRFMKLKRKDKRSDDIEQFVDATPQAIDQLNETIEDCIHDVKVTCHPTTAKARTRQLNELGEQVRQFAFDFEGFAKNLSCTTVLEVEQAILPHQQVHSIPELETQAQELWQEYHPESEEVFWGLYDELLAKVSK